MPRRNFSLKTPSERTTFGIYLSPCASRNTRDGQRRRGGEATQGKKVRPRTMEYKSKGGKDGCQQLMPREPLRVIHVARDFLPRYIFISSTTTPSFFNRSTLPLHARQSAEAASSNTKEIQSSSSCALVSSCYHHLRVLVAPSFSLYRRFSSPREELFSTRISSASSPRGTVSSS